MPAFFTGPSIAWGPGAIEQLSALGIRRAIVLADPAVAAGVGVRRIVEELEKSDAAVERVDWTGPADALPTVTAARDRARAFAPDAVVAVGGGRTIDGAKAVRLGLELPDVDLAQLPPLLPPADDRRVRLVAVPTTSGSGAEASWVADLVGADGEPLEIAERRLTPEWALVDPAWAEPLPREAWVPGALETAALATEAYLSAWSNPFSDALAVQALATVVQRLPNAVRWSDDPDARPALHYAATAAGLAVSNAQRGIAHALARALAGPTRLPYATALGIVLPAVLDFDRPGARERIEALARAVGGPDDRGPLALEARLRRLYPIVRFPADLAAAGAPKDRWFADRAQIVRRTLRSPAVLANPRVPNAHDVEQLLDAVAGPPA
ncbi:MAG TPA: iron-containing alcohol dehydrogenase [Thermoplasmata archaeon]|nr:iron-containing alcohol dehydrogenase [Thermoplasmata archaeon]